MLIVGATKNFCNHELKFILLKLVCAETEDVNKDIIETKSKPAKKKMKEEIIEAELSADEVEAAVNDSKSKKHRKKVRHEHSEHGLYLHTN